MSDVVPVLLIGVGLVFVVLLVVFHYSRGSSLLEEWAARNGYRVVSRENRLFFKGPFFWTTSKGQEVYYVTLEDEKGDRRNAWVRCGGWVLGMLSNNVEVRWDD
jgi:hypothetical protein